VGQGVGQPQQQEEGESQVDEEEGVIDQAMRQHVGHRAHKTQRQGAVVSVAQAAQRQSQPPKGDL
jgi:hypothetical protein